MRMLSKTVKNGQNCQKIVKIEKIARSSRTQVFSEISGTQNFSHFAGTFPGKSGTDGRSDSVQYYCTFVVLKHNHIGWVNRSVPLSLVE